MSTAAYSQCAIRFTPNDTRPERDYSDRSIIELRENDYGDYSLRAIDIANNQKVIFNLKLTRRDMYEFGSSPESTDKVRYDNGIYYLLLKRDTRENFHKTLQTCFERLESVQQATPDVSSKIKLSDNVSRLLLGSKTIADGNDNMNVVACSTCRIQFTPDDEEETPEQNYSERSIVELRQNDITDYSIRAIDVENNNVEIFNFRVEESDQYDFGILPDEPDKISDILGTYQLWLNQESRSRFHETFYSILEILFPDERINSDSDCLSESSIPIELNEPKEIDKVPNPTNCNARDVLTNIRKLSRCIKQGNDDEAARIAKELASKNIRLQLKSLKQSQNEEEFPILVQFDGNEYNIQQNGGTIPVDVFPSTTIRELRAVFELAYNYSPASQYFFVNGDLAHDNSTMRDLKVGPNSIFVLFLIVHPKQFKNNGCWNCSSCSTQNQQDGLRCSLCMASRIN